MREAGKPNGTSRVVIEPAPCDSLHSTNHRNSDTKLYQSSPNDAMATMVPVTRHFRVRPFRPLRPPRGCILCPNRPLVFVEPTVPLPNWCFYVIKILRSTTEKNAPQLRNRELSSKLIILQAACDTFYQSGLTGCTRYRSYHLVKDCRCVTPQVPR